jgi:hypothetical protein
MFCQIQIQGHDYSDIQTLINDLGGSYEFPHLSDQDKCTIFRHLIWEDWRCDDNYWSDTDISRVAAVRTTVKCSKHRLKRYCDRYDLLVLLDHVLIPTVIESPDGWVFDLVEKGGEKLWLALDGTNLNWSETHQYLLGDREVEQMPLEQQPYLWDFRILRLNTVTNYQRGLK